MAVIFEILWGQNHHISFEQSINFECSMCQWDIPRNFYIPHKIILRTFFRKINISTNNIINVKATKLL